MLFAKLRSNWHCPSSTSIRFLCITALACVAVSTAGAEPRKDRTVVVISLDGFPAYALDDPRLPMPTLRKLVREGVSSSMTPVNPTVTWPNHTAMVTGVDASEHHVLFGGLLTRSAEGSQPAVEAWRDKDVMVHAPTIYDAAFHAGLTTAQVDWVAIYGAKTINWQFPELPSPDGVIEQDLMADGLVTADQLRTFESGSEAWQDEIWTDAAIKILEKRRPNLLLFHLLMLDNANHAYGPMSMASYTAMALLDSNLRRIMDALQKTGLLPNAAVIVVSDHGFRPFKYKIHPNVLLAEKGILHRNGSTAKGDAWVMPDGGVALVYVTNPSRRADVTVHLRSVLAGAEGVGHVYSPEEYSSLGIPTPAASDQGPDLFLAAAPDYLFSDGVEGDYKTTVTVGGTHGYLNTDPKMKAIFVAWGAGIGPSRLPGISNLDVAPTIAALLGLEMPKAKGHVIQEVIGRSDVR